MRISDWSSDVCSSDLHFPGTIDAATLTSWLPRMILHDDVADRFSGLHWWCREFEADAPKLLLSDLPLHWEGGFNQPGFFLKLPIEIGRASCRDRVCQYV